MLKKIITLLLLLSIFSSAKAQDTAIMKLDSSWFNKDYTAAWDSMMRVLHPVLPKDNNAFANRFAS